MKVEIKGIRHGKGQFDNGNTWENYKLHCVRCREIEGTLGHEVEIYKATPTLFDDFMRKNALTQEKLINLKVDVEVSAKNVVQYIELVK